MATFRKRGSGSWQARIQRKGHPDLTKSFGTKAEAQTWARQIEAEIDRGNYSAPAPIETDGTTLRDLLCRYLELITPKKKGAIHEGHRVKSWINSPIANKPLAEIKSSDFAKWRDERLGKELSPNTVRLDLAVISNVYSIARTEWGFESLANPIKLIKLPKLPNGRTRRLTPEELRKLIQALEYTQEVHQIVQLAVETGMRRSELLGMTWENVDTAKRVVLLPDTKNGDSREVPLSSRALEVLNSVGVKTEGPVFTTKPDSVSQAFSRACKRANLKDLRFHDLRHEATSRLFEKGLNTMEVSAITGHKTLSMLKRYTHLKASDLALRLG
ncbi:site-specific integrase [Methylomonas sp. EFPC3]|uniref:tyrosine-type recombinase/integrase n=1 Tax=Methylomonas sp. EFPC3 TaxID=3021710 RepID=UPI002417E75B|nr:site-specific integrase [Methylomonas sp. EFPC3]WFP48490.1 site-specific integrase [Methylomonas sp. EFPC3]